MQPDLTNVNPVSPDMHLIQLQPGNFIDILSLVGPLVSPTRFSHLSPGPVSLRHSPLLSAHHMCAAQKVARVGPWHPAGMYRPFSTTNLLAILQAAGAAILDTDGRGQGHLAWCRPSTAKACHVQFCATA
jgi:hypothetical protein